VRAGPAKATFCPADSGQNLFYAASSIRGLNWRLFRQLIQSRLKILAFNRLAVKHLQEITRFSILGITMPKRSIRSSETISRLSSTFSANMLQALQVSFPYSGRKRRIQNGCGNPSENGGGAGRRRQPG
jgi:hypothetical protein